MIILLLIICYRQSICAWLYYRGCSCLKMDEKYDDPYDVFLMYSEEDEDLALGELAKGESQKINTNLKIKFHFTPVCHFF